MTRHERFLSVESLIDSLRHGTGLPGRLRAQGLPYFIGEVALKSTPYHATVTVHFGNKRTMLRSSHGGWIEIVPDEGVFVTDHEYRRPFEAKDLEHASNNVDWRFEDHMTANYCLGSGKYYDSHGVLRGEFDDEA